MRDASLIKHAECEPCWAVNRLGTFIMRTGDVMPCHHREIPRLRSRIIGQTKEECRHSKVTAPTRQGKIAILPRDGEPISTKAKYVQMAGAIGCVILDAGKCVDFDQKCFPGSHKNRGEYFGEVDPLKAWSSVRIPVVFALNNMESTNFFDSVVNQPTA